ncbi:MAG: HDOD domain-containing protein [Dissulfurispiraceae bacterium]
MGIETEKGNGIVPHTEESHQSTTDLILARLQEYHDFPAMSNTVDVMNRFKASEDVSVSEFANIILKDYGLTSKILKLVNSVSYAQFGEVTTISRAIVLIGFENIKNLAVTLMLFDYFQKNSSNPEHVDTKVKSLYSAIMAQKVSHEKSLDNEEEAFICSLFHTFGKMLVTFALPEKIEEIKLLSSEKGISENEAALSVLGERYEEVGVAMARDWHFPTIIINSMHKLRGMEITTGADKLDKLNVVAFFSNEVANILSTTTNKYEMDEKIGKLARTFRPHLGDLDRRMDRIINASLDDLNEFSRIFNVNLSAVPFTRQLLVWAGKPEQAVQPKNELLFADFSTEELETIDIILDSEKRDTPESIFTKGIQDINSSILSDFNINDVVRIVLETMYRGMQLSGQAKALFLVKETKAPIMKVRFGFGSRVEELKKWFEISLDDPTDIFNISIVKGHDLVVKNIESPDIKKLLPKWFRSKAFSRIFFVILPIIVNKKPLGIFYIEGDREDFQKVSAVHLNYLKMLRDQTVVAIRQKHWY